MPSRFGNQIGNCPGSKRQSEAQAEPGDFREIPEDEEGELPGRWATSGSLPTFSTARPGPVFGLLGGSAWGKLVGYDGLELAARKWTFAPLK